MRLSVIVSTYNNPRALGLVFTGIARQTRAADEIVIADDGSGPQTGALVAAWASRLSIPVRHVWHPDEGFRKCRILNRAIEAATGDYLVFFDGDCVPSKQCLAVHVARAAPKRYVSGGKVLLGPRASAWFDERKIARGDLDRMGAWWADVAKKHRLLLGALPGIRDVLDRNVRRPPGWRGENASTWATHARAVGGFDERFSYGYEDADFGQRLLLAGVVGVSVRYSAPVYHFHHERPWRTPAVSAANKALYVANRAAGMIVTPYGLHGDGALP
jgi:glycosyltransferase involved in cell wall biosynthesis